MTSTEQKQTIMGGLQQQQQRQQPRNKVKLSLPVGAVDPVLNVVAQRILELEMRTLSTPPVTSSSNLELCTEHRLRLLLDLVSRYPLTCQRTYRVALKDGRIGEQYPLFTFLSLHQKHRRQVISSCWTNLIQATVQAFPEALKFHVAANGFRCIDLACWKHAPLSVVQCLHSYDPAAISTPCHGALMLPLSIALHHHSLEFEPLVDIEQVLHFLLDRHPLAARHRDSLSGKFPLHHASAASAAVPISVMKRLVELCPESVTAVDNKGWTPLHYACRYRRGTSTVSAVQFLLLQQPSTIASLLLITPNQNGNTPLDFCAMYQSPQVLELVLNFHEQVRQEHPDQILPDSFMTSEDGINLLHRASRCNQADSVEYLLMRLPSMINTTRTATVNAIGRDDTADSAMKALLNYVSERDDDPVGVVRMLLQHSNSCGNSEQNHIILELLERFSHQHGKNPHTVEFLKGHVKGLTKK